MYCYYTKAIHMYTKLPQARTTEKHMTTDRVAHLKWPTAVLLAHCTIHQMDTNVKNRKRSHVHRPSQAAFLTHSGFIAPNLALLLETPMPFMNIHEKQLRCILFSICVSYNDPLCRRPGCWCIYFYDITGLHIQNLTNAELQPYN